MSRDAEAFPLSIATATAFSPNPHSQPLLTHLIPEYWCNMQARSQQTGFSLLEAIVCLTIMAMMFTVVFQSFSGSLRAVRVGEEYSQATIGTDHPSLSI